ncbi:MAG: hypothetical protein K6B74_13890, partial [Ruminococcus sp.]|nr:hypothetical protein [Ruminococcus sp.]
DLARGIAKEGVSFMKDILDVDRDDRSDITEALEVADKDRDGNGIQDRYEQADEEREQKASQDFDSLLDDIGDGMDEVLPFSED